jgi:hypothetical protein
VKVYQTPANKRPLNERLDTHTSSHFMCFETPVPSQTSTSNAEPIIVRIKVSCFTDLRPDEHSKLSIMDGQDDVSWPLSRLQERLESAMCAG